MPIFYLTHTRTNPFVCTYKEHIKKKIAVSKNPGIISPRWESEWTRIEAKDKEEAIKKFILARSH